MSRPVTIAFAAVAAFLFLFPLTLAKPGLPLSLKSDEPAYYLMALSIAHDHDLRCDVGDIQRLGVEFPYNTTKNLILASDDGWKTVYFGKPYLVSLIAAPMTALFGADGFVATNMALLLWAVWLGARYLRQYNPDWLALLFSAGFFLLSNAFAYVFWLHTEVLCITSVTACLYLGFTRAPRLPPARGALGRLRSGLAREPVRLALSGAALVAGAYNKPYLALLGLPVAAIAWRRDGARRTLPWLAGFALAGLAVCAPSIVWIGKPTPYLGLARSGVQVEGFDRMPELPVGLAKDSSGAAANSFAWIFDSFRVDASTLPNLGYFLVGRHTGLFPYAPFTLLSLGLFIFRRPRSFERWLLLACLAGVALYSITFIWFNWHGGGGFIGNRYYVNAVPGFLFLVTEIAPVWLPAIGYALGGLFLGGIVFTPFGAVVDSPTLQAHTRNGPFQLLPFERTLSSQIPGYRGLPATAGSFLSGRADLFRPIGDSLWVMGGQRVDFDLKTPAPLERPVFEVATFIAPNRIELGLGGVRTRVELESATPPGNVTRVVLPHPRARSEHQRDGGDISVYTLSIDASRQVWHHEEVRFRESKKVPRAKQQPAEGVQLPDWEDSEINALVGAIVTYLGEQSELDADVFSVEWLALPLPETLPAGRIVALPVRLKNSSPAVWRAVGAIAVDLSYHWLREDGSVEVWEGMRTELPQDVAPGETVALPLEIETPRRPGSYRLVVEPVRERVAWFSERRPEAKVERPVEIVRPEGR